MASKQMLAAAETFQREMQKLGLGVSITVDGKTCVICAPPEPKAKP